MAETIETLLVGIGVDPNSLKAIQESLQQVKNKLAQKPIELPIAVSGNALTQVASSFKQIGVVADQAQIAVAAFGASIFGIQKFFREASSEAAAGELATRKLEVAFGAAAGQAEVFASKTAAAFNRGDTAAKEALATFGLFIQGFGLTQEAALRLSEQVLQVGFKIGTELGKKPEEVIQLLEVALVRGGRAARQLGLDMSDAAVKAKALSQGLDPKTLSQAEQIQIKLALAVEQSAARYDNASNRSKLFVTSIAELQAQVSEVIEAFGRYINKALQPLIEVLTPVVKGIRNFIDNHKELMQTIASGALVIGGIIAAITGFIGVILSAAGFLKALQLTAIAIPAVFNAIAVSINSVSTAASTLPGIIAVVAKAMQTLVTTSILGSLKSFVGLLGLAGLVAAAAAAGVAVGMLVDKVFGISTAFAKAAADQKAFEIESQKAKYLGIIWRDNAIAVEMYNQARLRGKSENRAAAEASEYARLSEQVKRAGGNTQQFVDLVQAGVPKLQAYGESLDNHNRLIYLYTLGIERSKEQQSEFNELLKKSGMTEEQLIAITGRLSEANQSGAEATKEHKTALEELIKWIEKSSDAQLTSSDKLVSNFTKNVDLFARQAARVKEGSAEWVTSIRAIGTSTEKAFSDLAANMDAQRKRLSAVFDQQVADARRTKDSLIAVYDAQLAGLNRTLSQLKPAADSANASLKSFSKEQETAKLAAIDSRLVEIQTIRETLTENLKSATSMDERAKAIKLANDRLAELSKVTKDDQTLQKEVADAQIKTQQTIFDWKNKNIGTYKDVQAAQADQLEKEKQLAERTAAQAKVNAEAQAAAKAIADTDKATAATAQENAKKIAETEKNILAFENAKVEAEKNFVTATLLAYQALTQQLAILKQMDELQKGRIQLEENRARVIAGGALDTSKVVKDIDAQIDAQQKKIEPIQKALDDLSAKQARQAQERAVQAPAAAAQGVVQEAQLGLVGAQGNLEKDLQEKAKGLEADLKNAKDAFAEVIAKLQPDIAAATQQIANIQAQLPTVSANVEDMVSAEFSVSTAIGDLTATLNNQFTGLAGVVEQNAADIKALRDSIKRIKLPTKGAVETGDEAAAGLPGD